MKTFPSFSHKQTEENKTSIVGMNAVAKQIKSYTSYKGSRTVSKTDKLVLFEFLRCVFEHNHLSKKSQRLTDNDIKNFVLEEFGHDKAIVDRINKSKTNPVANWRGLFNAGRLHRSVSYSPDFVALRVNPIGQFAISSSTVIPIRLHELEAIYKKHKLAIPEKVREEVAAYVFPE